MWMLIVGLALLHKDAVGQGNIIRSPIGPSSFPKRLPPIAHFHDNQNRPLVRDSFRLPITNRQAPPIRTFPRNNPSINRSPFSSPYTSHLRAPLTSPITSPFTSSLRSAPTSPITSPFTSHLRSPQSSSITSSIRRSSSSHSDACFPSPCGPNTRCETSNHRGVATCRCLDNFIPDFSIVDGCKAECVSDFECRDDQQCRRQRCTQVCGAGACGLEALCDARNHRAMCSCPRGYHGSASVRCIREPPAQRSAPAPPLNPCSPNPCGANADCRPVGEVPICSCIRGYIGDPLTSCIKGECFENYDCNRNMTCQGMMCVSPCFGACGTGADCVVRNHHPRCSCPRNALGDPLVQCRSLTQHDICNPSPCGRNTNCNVKIDGSGFMRSVCTCVDNSFGNPLTECRLECVTDNECNPNQHCRGNRCVNPCTDGCGEGAYCEARQHSAVCSCPPLYQGDPKVKCSPECVTHDDCPESQNCFQFRCFNPCVGSCGTGADCKVVLRTPVCSCPAGFTGDPFVSCRHVDPCNPNPCGTGASCRPADNRPGTNIPVCTCPHTHVGNPLVSCIRGECEDDMHCSDHLTCYGYTCQNPCFLGVGPVCGEKADCTSLGHKAVCTCPRGYEGNPKVSCRISPMSRIMGRSNN